jgi:hypothetical protein
VRQVLNCTSQEEAIMSKSGFVAIGIGCEFRAADEEPATSISGSIAGVLI